MISEMSMSSLISLAQLSNVVLAPAAEITELFTETGAAATDARWANNILQF